MFTSSNNAFDQSLTWDDPQFQVKSGDESDNCGSGFLPFALGGFPHSSASQLGGSHPKITHSLPRQVSIRRTESLSSSFSSSGSLSQRKPKTLMKRLSRSFSRSFSSSVESGQDEGEYPEYLETMRSVAAKKSCSMGKINKSGKFAPATLVK